MNGQRISAKARAWMLLGLCLAANVLIQRQSPPVWTDVGDLDTPPQLALTRAASLGEDIFAGYLADLFLQNFNVSLGRATPVAAMDRSAVIRWLDLTTELDADSRYPDLLAARHFAETGTPEQRRRMFDWIYQRFQERPNERWPWLVHAVFAARHVLHDDALAQRYAAALRMQVTDPKAPSWVAQMDLLLRADLGEAEDARAILGGLIEAGQIRSPGELKFLESRIAAVQPPLPKL
ncbi:MAG TPA: hypothetical protein VNZ02_10325 [Steroidobacteraceae bacterium]|nr:hypothetical protein [Steroidobacteraceae bacterium]